MYIWQILGGCQSWKKFSAQFLVQFTLIMYRKYFWYFEKFTRIKIREITRGLKIVTSQKILPDCARRTFFFNSINGCSTYCRCIQFTLAILTNFIIIWVKNKKKSWKTPVCWKLCTNLTISFFQKRVLIHQMGVDLHANNFSIFILFKNLN